MLNVTREVIHDHGIDLKRKATPDEEIAKRLRGFARDIEYMRKELVRMGFTIEKAVGLPEAQRTPTIETIQKAACQRYGVTMIELCGDCRSGRVVHARMVAVFLCRSLTGRSSIVIGNKFGHRNHTTILHSSKIIDRRRKIQPALQIELSELAASIKDTTFD